MDPINKALEEVENTIPPHILRYAFIGNSNVYSRIPVNLQSLIRDKVIGHRVIPDCNINGGVRDMVKLTGLPFRQTEEGYRIYSISKSLTGGRSIINPLSVGNSHYITTVQDGGVAQGASLGALTNRITNANLNMLPFHTTDVRCVGENLILVEDIWDDLGADAWLWAVMSNDDMMSTLPMRSWNVFEDLVVLATKAWIFNNTIVDMDSGVIEMGMEVGRFREVIDGYSDANEMYREMIKTKWRKVSLLSDKSSKKRMIRNRVPRR